MSVRKFSGEDEFEPFRPRPRGYVPNTDSGMSGPGSTRLHRVSCFTLEPGFGGCERQTVDYIKVCPPDPTKLNTGGRWQTSGSGCGACAASTAIRRRSG